MAGEVILVNARGRGRRKKARARRRGRARARVAVAINRRRPRRHRITARRRAHRNPRIPFLGNVNINGILGGTGGYLGTRYGTGWLMSLAPQISADPNTAPWIRMGIKALVGLVGLPMLARMLRMRGLAGPLAIGGGIAVAQDLFDTFVKPAFPIADYETQTIEAYETQEIGQGAYGATPYQM